MPPHHSQNSSFTASLEALYERCLEELKKRLDHTTTLTAETVRAAAEAARESLSKARGIRQEDLHAVMDILLKNWQHVLEYGELTGKTMQRHPTVQLWTERGLSVLAHLAKKVKTLAEDVESRLQRALEYHTGTVVGEGNFLCIQCNKEIHKTKPGPLPPCSRCRGTVFRRRL